MPVIIKKSSPWYISSVALAAALWISASTVIIRHNEWDKAKWFMLHPLCNTLGLFIMTIGVLEQNTTLLHVPLMLLAGTLYIISYAFMFTAHQIKEVSHIGIGTGKDGKTEALRVTHVWFGYLALACWIVQICGGLAKFSNLPEKTVRWHGVLANVLFVLVCVTPAFSSFFTLKIPKDGNPGWGEFLFAIGFLLLGFLVMMAVQSGVRRKDGEDDNEVSEDRPLRSLPGGSPAEALSDGGDGGGIGMRYTNTGVRA